ncbi:MAG: hypothetical protein ACOYNY_12870 [Caldilineaceae bacterium]
MHKKELRIPAITLKFWWPDEPIIWQKWLPSRGNVLFTLLVIGIFFWAQNAGAISLGTPVAATASTASIPYQGRLADKNGAPLTQTVNMIFRLYTAAGGGSPLWEEQWTGSNSVQMSDGLFNVMLSSLTPIPQSVITGNSNLFLGITVGTDSEMSPRVQLGSVPFAAQALTVPDASIAAEKLSLQQGTQCLTQLVDVTHPGGNALVPISGLQLDFTLTQASKVMVWIDGLARPIQGQDAELGVWLMLDNKAIAGSHATFDNIWFNIKSQRLVSLSAGQHTLNTTVYMPHAGTLRVHPQNSDGNTPSQTCVNYLVLGK